MRLQDLKAIASHVEVWWSDPGLRTIMPGEHACIDALVKLARRVADLFEECDHEKGRVTADKCAYCDRGSRKQIASEAFHDLWKRHGLYYARDASDALSQYLFGEDG